MRSTNLKRKFAKSVGQKYAVALNSGTDALTLGLYLLGVKKEVMRLSRHQTHLFHQHPQ